MLENERAQYVYEHKIKARKLGVEENSWKDQLGNWRSSVNYEISKDGFFACIKKGTVLIKSDYLYAMRVLIYH